MSPVRIVLMISPIEILINDVKTLTSNPKSSIPWIVEIAIH